MASSVDTREPARWSWRQLAAVVVAMGASTAVNVLSGGGSFFLVTPVGATMLVIMILVPRQQLWPCAALLALTTMVVYSATIPDPVDDAMYLVVTVIATVAVQLPTALILRRDRQWVDGTRESAGAWLRFIAWGVVISSVVTALLNSVTRITLDVGPVPWDVFWVNTLIDLLLFVVAKLLVVPAVIRLRPTHMRHIPRRWPELISSVLAVAVLTAAVMTPNQVVLLFAIPIPLGVIVVRHGAVGATLGALVVLPVVLIFTQNGLGPFVAAAAGEARTAMVLSQVFLGLMMAANLALVVALDDRERNRSSQFEQLHRESVTDELTDVANRRRFRQELIAAHGAAVRVAEPLSLLLLDIDRFKEYNDHYGHQVGDQALVSVARAIGGAVLRPRDLVARYGGEEFAILLPDTDADAARHVAERVRSAVAELAIDHVATESGRLTVSIGVATATRSTTTTEPEDIISASDTALYRAKHRGRNRVEAISVG